MGMTRRWPAVVLVFLVLISLSASVLALSTTAHEHMGCPFAPGTVSVCDAAFLDHWQHWQLAFAAIILEFLLLAGIALASCCWMPGDIPQTGFAVVRIRKRLHDRLTLFQELVRKGILNRKEPDYTSELRLASSTPNTLWNKNTYSRSLLSC